MLLLYSSETGNEYVYGSTLCIFRDENKNLRVIILVTLPVIFCF